MAKRKRKKCVKYRGQTTHGWGSMKKHRGAGNRGGRGMAGTGKRGDAKKPSIDVGTYFGKHGFKSIKKISKGNKDSINISDLDKKLANLIKNKAAEEKSGMYSIDLGKLGYIKLLGTGDTKNKYILKISSASKSAITKIEQAGGKVETEAKKVKQAKETKNV
ncbi:uL15 family ribosomal protein, partial [Candidatus Woesearchaeota archaeon]|nr:uL15 family ribosomal protein [Candidatus Woesearchaeota archaeon]